MQTMIIKAWNKYTIFINECSSATMKNVYTTRNMWCVFVCERAVISVSFDKTFVIMLKNSDKWLLVFHRISDNTLRLIQRQMHNEMDEKKTADITLGCGCETKGETFSIFKVNINFTPLFHMLNSRMTAGHLRTRIGLISFRSPTNQYIYAFWSMGERATCWYVFRIRIWNNINFQSSATCPSTHTDHNVCEENIETNKHKARIYTLTPRFKHSLYSSYTYFDFLSFVYSMCVCVQFTHDSFEYSLILSFHSIGIGTVGRWNDRFSCIQTQVRTLTHAQLNLRLLDLLTFENSLSKSVGFLSIGCFLYFIARCLLYSV